MFKIIFTICITLVASDMLSWNGAMNSNRHHRATNLNRVRFGEEAFAGMKLRELPKKPAFSKKLLEKKFFDKKKSKTARNSLRNSMRRSFSRNLLD